MGNSERVREARIRRHASMRRKVVGSSERPRLNVFRSLRHIYAQIIDDGVGHTLISASTMEKEVLALTDGMQKGEAAKVVGRVLAERALARGVTKVVFDRGGYKYHGRVRALAEAAREAGLDF
jgi:large subunit ribosomal protein L18